jgi:four helix bundle protein
MAQDSIESGFPHHRLDAYHLAVELVCESVKIARRLSGTYPKIADNLLRSSQGVALLIGEGANRYTPAQKRQRFMEARGEVGECAVALELAVALRVVSSDEVAPTLASCGRIGAMLTGLIQKSSE